MYMFFVEFTCVCIKHNFQATSRLFWRFLMNYCYRIQTAKRFETNFKWEQVLCYCTQHHWKDRERFFSLYWYCLIWIWGNFFLSGIGFTEGSRKWEVSYILELNQQVYFYLCFCITCMFFMRSVLPYIDLVYKSKFILTCGILRWCCAWDGNAWKSFVQFLQVFFKR